MLGADMPVAELSVVAERGDCHAIVLSGSINQDCNELSVAIKQLTANTDVPVFIGGDITKKCDQKITNAGAILFGY